ncbi:carbohydrate ABC transporter permease [Marispirochaeta aestuarii]|uniref:carbohydrate ABC transporter permease n=1 Tax=Marispirochaeta aestuarii TaxID=1963862 RepID=UPI0029C844BF|nr:carbohydrate ABC transporter permease [Marispirochaeta aestuarii]
MTAIQRRILIKTVSVHAALLVLTLFVLAPFLWMFMTSFKTNPETLRYPPSLLPDSFDIQNFIRGWQTMRFGTYFGNTLYVSLMTACVSVLIGSLGGYALARFRIPGERLLILGILVTRMFPPVVFLVPFFIFLRHINLIDTYSGLILAFTVFSLPLAIWMLRGFFRNVPKQLEEAAMIDGCSRMGAFFRIIVPLSSPGVATTGVFCFILAWNEFMFANTLILTESKRLLTVSLVASISEYLVEWNVLMAGGILTTIPVVIMYLFMQKYITSGLTEGSVVG